jgi:hypothetical protein
LEALAKFVFKPIGLRPAGAQSYGLLPNKKILKVLRSNTFNIFLFGFGRKAL